MAADRCGDFHTIPEGCVANVLSLTSPKEACRLSAVDSSFLSASQSDTVWECFLPSDYRDILSRAVDGSNSLLRISLPKKELYLHLCDHPVLMEGGRKTFSLDKLSGKKCYMLGARELYIVWVNTPEYWQWVSTPASRFSALAVLRRVCWLEIQGQINVNMLSSDTRYAAYLVFGNGARAGGDLPAEGSVTVGGNKGENRRIRLDPEGAQRPNLPLDPNTEQPRLRDDGWMEVELGECFVGGGEDGDLKVSYMDVENGNWKHGLVVEGIEIRPKTE